MRKVIWTLLLFFLVACTKEISSTTEQASIPLAEARDIDKITVCHKGANSSSNVMITISISAWPAHQAHGDVRLDDQDGDGYVPANSCGFGQMGDCDDANANVHPGAIEVCGNSVDENCDGVIDNNCFETVSICGKTWMKSNLDVSNYRNGDPIPQVTDPAQWASMTSGAWCYYNNDPALGEIYGKLYNWYAVNDPRGLAPAGWHVSTDNDWQDLCNCLGCDTEVGGKLKEAGLAHWWGPNSCATNSSGFTALPGGYRAWDGNSYVMIFNGNWWTSTQSCIGCFGGAGAWTYRLENSNCLLQRSHDDIRAGYSVRCVKD